MTSIPFLLTLLFCTVVPAFSMEKEENLSHIPEINALTSGKNSQFLKSLKTKPMSTIAWSVDQYAQQFGFNDLQKSCSYKKINGRPDALKEGIYCLQKFINQNYTEIIEEGTPSLYPNRLKTMLYNPHPLSPFYRIRHRLGKKISSAFVPTSSRSSRHLARILKHLNFFDEIVDKYREKAKKNSQKLQAHPLFGYYPQANTKIPKGLIFPFHIDLKSLAPYIQSMPESEEKDDYKTIYQALINNKPISVDLQNKHGLVIDSLKNAIGNIPPMVWEISENVKQDLEIITEQYKHTRVVIKFKAYSNVDIDSLFQILNHCPAPVIGLEFSSLRLSTENIKHLGEALREKKFITSLNLMDNNIGVEGAKVLAEVLKNNKTLTSLTFVFNKIGVEGAKAITEVLKNNTTLNHVNLGHNNIGDEGAKMIAEALKDNKALTSLTLNFNHIGDEGVKALAGALKDNKALTFLELWLNEIGNLGKMAITEMLKINKTLKVHL